MSKRDHQSQRFFGIRPLDKIIIQSSRKNSHSTTSLHSAPTHHDEESAATAPSDLTTIPNEVAARLVQLRSQFQEPFDRWRFLQTVLDIDDDDGKIPDKLAITVEQLLYFVFQGFLQRHDSNHSLALAADSQESRPNWLTLQLLQRLQEKLEPFHNGGLIPIMTTNPVDSDDSSSSWIEWLEELLPDPQDDEDAFKGLWDVVMELHGRESVKYHEMSAASSTTSTWKLRCLLVRILIHFDFLADGITM